MDFTELTVLILDDDEYQCHLIGKMLQRIGVEQVYETESAKLATEIIDNLTDTLDLVITDLDMPEVDGMEFLRTLSEKTINIPVLIVSGKQSSILRSVNVMAKEYGLTVVGAIEKPLKLPELSEILSLLLKKNKIAVSKAPNKITIDEISQALLVNQFVPFFQPKMDLKAQKLCGVEALVRWNHPKRGLLFPDTFIDLTEKYGLMDQLTWTILKQSIAQLKLWRDDGLNISMSVNFSQTSITDTQLPKKILNLMSEFGLAPELLVVEITETVAMTDIAHALETLSRLRLMGFGLSIDDFGTGHASLEMLSRIPYTELKIDRVFVTDAHAKTHLQPVIESSVSMANKLGLDCVGEGVETAEDMNFLLENGCGIGQGYFFGKAMSTENFQIWLDSTN